MIQATLPHAMQRLLADGYLRSPVDAPPIRRIALIGGLVDTKNRLGLNDIRGLRQCFKVCAKRGIGIDPNATIEVQNLEYDEDFLKTPPKADLVAFLAIPHDPRGIGGVSIMRQSFRACDPGRWHDSLVKTEAQYAFNIYGSMEWGNLPNALLEGDIYHLDEIVPGVSALSLPNCAVFCR